MAEKAQRVMLLVSKFSPSDSLLPSPSGRIIIIMFYFCALLLFILSNYYFRSCKVSIRIHNLSIIIHYD